MSARAAGNGSDFVVSEIPFNFVGLVAGGTYRKGCVVKIARQMGAVGRFSGAAQRLVLHFCRTDDADVGFADARLSLC